MRSAFNNTNESTHLLESKKEKLNLARVGLTREINQSKEEKNLRKDLFDIRREHLKEIRDLRASFKSEINILKRKFDTQLRIEKDGQRKTYDEMKLLLQKEQEKMVKTQLRETINNYSDLALNYHKELDAIRQIQHKHDDTMRKKDEEILQLKLELAKSNSDLQTKRIILQLAERNALIEKLQSRIEELEESITPMHGSGAHEESEDYATSADHDKSMVDIAEGEQIQDNRYERLQDIANGTGVDDYSEARIGQPDDVSNLDNDNGRGKSDSSLYDIGHVAGLDRKIS